MKKRIFALYGIIGLFLSSTAFSSPTVTLTAPSINSTYPAGSSTALTYHINNYVPKPLSVSSITGVSSPLSITNNCSTIPAGTSTQPGTCTINLTIAPSTAQAGTTINQQLNIYYGGRTALTSPISFQVTQPLNFAYVSTALNGILYKCGINSAGALTTCSPIPSTSPGWLPTSTYFTTFNSQLYAYISSYYGDVYQCAVENGNSFDNCKTVNPPVTPYSPVNKNITFATVSGTQYAYISQANTGPGTDVWQCNTDASSGELTSCQTAGGDYIWSNVFDVTIETFDHQYAYVVDNNASKIVRCTIDQTDGTFVAHSCTEMTPSGTSWVSPSAVTFATFNGTKYAYISDQDGHGALQCNVNQTTGAFTSCDPTSYSGGGSVFGIAFSTINNTTYAYLSLLGGQVWTCPTDSDSGNFISCSEQSPTFTGGPSSFGNVFWVAFKN